MEKLVNFKDQYTCKFCMGGEKCQLTFRALLSFGRTLVGIMLCLWGLCSHSAHCMYPPKYHPFNMMIGCILLGNFLLKFCEEGKL